MRRELEYAVEYERTALEEDVAPVPAIVFHDVMRLGFDPQVESNQCNTTDPSHHVRRQGKVVRYAEAGKREHAVRHKVTVIRSRQMIVIVRDNFLT